MTIDTNYVFCQTEVMPSLLVAAIDFGTTFSGYAFSLLHEYKKDPLKIATTTWTAGSRNLVSLKTSSAFFLIRQKNFILLVMKLRKCIPTWPLRISTLTGTTLEGSK